MLNGTREAKRVERKVGEENADIRKAWERPMQYARKVGGFFVLWEGKNGFGSDGTSLPIPCVSRKGDSYFPAIALREWLTKNVTTLKPERFSGEPKTNSDRPPIKNHLYRFWGFGGM